MDDRSKDLEALLLLNCYLLLAPQEYEHHQKWDETWEAVSKNYSKIREWLSDNKVLSLSSNPGQILP